MNFINKNPQKSNPDRSGQFVITTKTFFELDQTYFSKLPCMKVYMEMNEHENNNDILFIPRRHGIILQIFI